MSTELRDEGQIALDPGVLIAPEHDGGLIAPYKERSIFGIGGIEVAQQVLLVGQVPVRIGAVRGVDVQLGTGVNRAVIIRIYIVYRRVLRGK